MTECRVKFMQEALLASERSGIVSSIDVREGDAVSAGQRILQLKDDVPRAEWATLARQSDSPASGARIQDARLAEEFATGRYQIAVTAQQRNPDAVSRAEMLELRIAAERARTEIDSAVLDLELVRLRKQELEAEVRSYQMRAPFAGTITRVMKHQGEAVQPGDTVAELVDPVRLKVEGYVSLQEARRLHSGLEVVAIEELDDAASSPPVRLAGKLIFVDVGVEPVSRRVRVWAEVDNARKLMRPGILARLEISLTAAP